MGGRRRVRLIRGLPPREVILVAVFNLQEAAPLVRCPIHGADPHVRDPACRPCHLALQVLTSLDDLRELSAMARRYAPTTKEETHA